ncbi:MAG: hypothetical protein IPK60_23765 [Sandaracinaceae bacterium]|nr:hypothetical protein [Sandaracinaceae bacterium]
MSQDAVKLLLFGAACGAVITLMLAYALRSSYRSIKAKRRSSRAMRGELNAESLLERSGFTITRRQVPQVFNVFVGETEHEIDLRADLLVTRGDRTFIAEVKTGEHAPSVQTTSTRRQLLEYCVAFDVDGVLLVNMEEETIAEVRFPIERERSAVKKPTAHRRWESAAVAVVAAILLVAWLSQRR